MANRPRGKSPLAARLPIRISPEMRAEIEALQVEEQREDLSDMGRVLLRRGLDATRRSRQRRAAASAEVAS